MTDTIKRIPLNGTRLRAARLTEGLGTRELARESGTTFTLIDSIEKENFIGSHVTLAELRAIARAATLTISELLDEQPDTTHTDAPPDDIQRLAAILIAERRMQNTDDLCLALGWTLQHLHNTCQALNTALQPLALHVHRNPGAICLRPTNPETHQDVTNVDARKTGREGMNKTEAQLLHRAISGTLSDKLPETARPALGHLTNLGYIRPGRRGEHLHELTDDCLDAFNID